MGQSQSKRRTSRQYQVEDNAVTQGHKKRYYRRRQSRAQRQQLDKHSQHIYQQQRQQQQYQQQNEQMRNVLSTRFTRRASQDYLYLQTHGGNQEHISGGGSSSSAAISRTPSGSWREMRYNAIASIVTDARQKTTGRYDVSGAGRRELLYNAHMENESIATTGYYSLDRRDNYSQDGSVRAREGHRRENRSKVTEQEIEHLAAELHDFDWMRLGSQLGLPVSRMTTFRERYHRNTALCATEMLLLWKQNGDELPNPRMHLALALSTIGREDLYSKIKKRIYLHKDMPQFRQELIPDDPRDSFTHPADEDQALHNTFEITESGVSTVGSQSDSLEEDSDGDNDNQESTAIQSNQETTMTIKVPLKISTVEEHSFSHQCQEVVDSQTVINNVDRGHAPSPQDQGTAEFCAESDLPSRLVVVSNCDLSKTDEMAKSALNVSDMDEIVLSAELKSSQDHLRPFSGMPSPTNTSTTLSSIKYAPSTSRLGDTTTAPPSSKLEAGKTVLYKSDVLLLPNEEPRSPGNSSVTGQPVNKNRVPHEGRDVAAQHENGPSSQPSRQVTEEELNVLAGDIRSSSEWRILGKRLGITQTEIRAFSTSYDENVTQCAFAVLKTWKQRNDKKARERTVLASVMSDVGRDDLYSAIMRDELLQRIKSVNNNLERWRQQLEEAYLRAAGDPTSLFSIEERSSGHQSTFIELELIRRDTEGAEKKLLNRHSIFRTGKKQRRQALVILHGDPGSGKTTLLQQLARDWAEKNPASCLSDVPLVLLLDIQRLRSCGSVGRGAMRYLLHKDPLTSAEMVDNFLKLYPDKVVLLLDGFDLTQKDFDDLHLLQQIQGQSQCGIVITSRLCPSEIDIFSMPYVPIQIQDMTVDQRKTYIQSYFQDVSTRKALEEYIKEDDIISSFCSRPMFLSIICNAWDRNKDLHEVNTISDVIMVMLCLMFQEHGSLRSNDDDTALKAIKEVLLSLGMIAFDGLLRQKQVFKTAELTNVEDSAEVATTIGLLLGSPDVQNEVNEGRSTPTVKETQDWQFCHPLVIEKCAGMHLASLCSSDSESFDNFLETLQSLEEIQALQYVLMFACGESIDVTKRILKLLGNLAWKNTDPQATIAFQELVLKCNFECHQEELLNKELQYNLRSLRISASTGNFLADINLRYFILSSITEAHCPMQVDQVHFMIETRLDLDYVTACLQKGYFRCVPKLHFHMPRSFSPSREAARKLSDDVISSYLNYLIVSSVLSSGDFISNLRSSEILEELEGSEIDPKYIDVPSWCQKYPNLNALRLSCIMYQDPCMLQDHRKSLQGLKDIICKLSNLKTLSLSNFYNSDLMIMITTKAIQDLPNLSYVQIGPSGQDLEHYSDEVEEACGEVADSTMQDFLKAAKKSTSLKSLKLSCFGNFEKLYQLMRSESRTKGRRPSGLNYSPDARQNGYWVFKR